MNENFFIIYIDESYDTTRYVYSALIVPAFEWNTVFSEVLSWRQSLWADHKIPTDYELHATKLVGGQGEPLARRDKDYRAQIFSSAFSMIERNERLKIINGITGNKKNHPLLFEWLMNRVNRYLEKNNAYGVIVCDEGNENRLISLVRKMRKFNLIWSQHNPGEMLDAPLSRIIEDPLFKTSKSSYFVQLADLVAFGLLRNESEFPTHKVIKSSFDQLDRALVKEAFSRDPRRKGIVRCK
jgi:hypothetical protein